MTDLNLKTFNKLYPMMIRKYSDLIVDQNASEKDKINSIILKLNALGKLSNDVVRDWNTVYQWAMNDGLTTDVNNKIEDMYAKGKFDTILNTVVTKMGDLATLTTPQKDTIVNSINSLQSEVTTNTNAITTNTANIATNTTQLASSTQRFSNNAVDAKMPLHGLNGLKMDGSDDTANYQALLDFTSANGYALSIPIGSFTVNSSIVLHTNRNYKIVGANNGIDAFSGINSCQLISNAKELFISDNASALVAIQMDMSGVFIRYNGIDPTSILFKGFNIQSSKIYHNSILNFGTIFKGMLTGVTHVFQNFIENISNCFSTYYLASTEGTLTDSFIHDNYLNGNPSYNITMFKNGYSNYTTISNNFIDFCKYIYSSVGGSTNVKWIDNTFDVCFRFSGYPINGNFIGNTFSKFSKAAYISSFPNPDSDMNTTAWGVFYQSLYFSSVIGNIITSCDSFYHIDTLTNNHDLKIANNTFVDGLTNMYFINYYIDTNNTADYKNIYIDDLMNTKYTTLPSMGLGTLYRSFFPNQTILLNGKLVRIDGDGQTTQQWLDTMGIVVSA